MDGLHKISTIVPTYIGKGGKVALDQNLGVAFDRNQGVAHDRQKLLHLIDSIWECCT